MSKKRIIFLDVDGVLITGRIDWKTPTLDCISALNTLIERTGAEIVVSSCWRVGRTIIELRELLAEWGVIGRVIGRTGGSKEQRGYEIGEFLLENDRYTDAAFVIIDDDKDMAGHINKLVQTKGHVGLTLENVEQAIKVLESQK